VHRIVGDKAERHGRCRWWRRAPVARSQRACHRARNSQALALANDAGKKVKGRKRHFVTDTIGLLVGAEVHAADVPDRDRAVLVIETIHDLFPWLRYLFADGAYAGDKLQRSLAPLGHWTIEIVTRSGGLEVLGEAAVAVEPGEGSLDHPAAGQQHKAFGEVCYPDGQLRTLQRRLKIWRREAARRMVFGTAAIDTGFGNSGVVGERRPVDLPLRLDDADASPTTPQGQQP
jgi:Transposase DDE domain